MRKHYLVLVAFLMLFLSSVNAQESLLAFPTAEGYGGYATGGRGGKVVEVTNLDDYIAYNDLEPEIPGSFRWALKQYPDEPLTIVFSVSGVIKLKPYLVNEKNVNDIRSGRPNLTIAGQTAPGEGICIRNSKVNFGGSTDLIVRNIRFRIGDNADDSTFLPGGSMGCENALRVIFDHCVFGWSGEENITMYDNRFTTVQWCVMHEGLYDDGHGKGNRSYGGQCGGSIATWHHNLFAHNYSRSPRLNGARTSNETRVFIEFINNVNYNWGRSNAPYGGDLSTGAVRSHTCNFVGNYYKPGPGTNSSHKFFNNNWASGTNLPRWYLNDNVMYGNTAMTGDNMKGFSYEWPAANVSQVMSDTLLFPPQNIVYSGQWIGYEKYKVKIESGENAYQSVLEKVGTLNRDSVERRIIGELKEGTALFSASQGSKGIIDKPHNAEGFLVYPIAEAKTDDDHDGMADEWELANGLDPTNPEDRNLRTSEGYTALEVYLAYLMGESIPYDFTTGLSNVAQRKVSVYPTFASHQLCISTIESSVKSVEFTTISGQIVKKINGNAYEIPLGDISKGHYLITVVLEDGRQEVFKFYKQ